MSYKEKKKKRYFPIKFWIILKIKYSNNSYKRMRIRLRDIIHRKNLKHSVQFIYPSRVKAFSDVQRLNKLIFHTPFFKSSLGSVDIITALKAGLRINRNKARIQPTCKFFYWWQRKQNLTEVFMQRRCSVSFYVAFPQRLYLYGAHSYG